MSDYPSIAVVRQVLSTHGPLSEDELLRVLHAEGTNMGPDADDVLSEVLDTEGELFLPLIDGRWAWIPAVLDGRIFTHLLSAAEVEHDFLNLGPDLAPVSMLNELETYRRLTDGAPITEVLPAFDEEALAARGVPVDTVTEDGALLLPPGRLAGLGVAAADLVGLRVSEQGFELTAVSDVAPCDVAAALNTLLQPDRPEELDAAVWTVCTAQAELFREPAAPLTELLSAGGLTYEGDWVARGDFDFAAWRLAGRIRRLKERYELDDDEALAVATMLLLHGQTLDLMDLAIAGQAPDDVRSELPERATLALLAEPVVADAVLTESGAPIDRKSAAALGLLAQSVESVAPRPARPALRWLWAKADELLGELDEAEAQYRTAETLDPSWPLTLISLARYASDRGDAEGALSLLRRAGAPADDEVVAMLERFRPTPRRDLGRNQPCWCGSGRKYKVCHLNREQAPLAERAAWLYQKAATDLLDGPFGPLLLEIAYERALYWDSPGSLERALQDSLVFDAVLFEGGAFAAFVAARGPLLPEDEQLLAEQWLLTERSVHEVLAVDRGTGMTLRDVRTGDVHEVREQAGSRQAQVGELYCARVVPAGDTWQIFGGVEPVSPIQRDDLIALLDDEPDPVELVATLSRRFAPPVLTNTEGEPLAMCTATLRVADPSALTAALDDVYDRDDDEPDEPLMWFEKVLTHGTPRIRAQLELSGDELRVHANSETRFERVLTTMSTLDPSLTLVSQTREPADDVDAIARLAARGTASPGALLDPATDPAVAAALEEIVRKHEAAWLDESIPALAGHTPRECANDPTRRPDLIRLLDSFPAETGRPGEMSRSRLRKALGLS